MTDNVNHPKHYCAHPSGVECIEVVEHMNYNLGNAIKYVWRAGIKHEQTQAEDLRKAAWYINREIERLSSLQEPARKEGSKYTTFDSAVRGINGGVPVSQEVHHGLPTAHFPPYDMVRGQGSFQD